VDVNERNNGTSGVNSASNAHEGIPWCGAQSSAGFSSNFSDRGCRRQPRSRRLDFCDLWRRDLAGPRFRPTQFSGHTQPRFHDREHLSTIVNTCSNRDRKSVHHQIGIPVHPRLERPFTIDWNGCSPCLGIRSLGEANATRGERVDVSG